ncbi:hypothetical protein ACWDUN_25155 [Mycobacterium sp. NPDC003323]
MTSPDGGDTENQPGDEPNTEVPTANPAYATPPPEGLPDADND